MREIVINTRILQDPFHIETSLIKVNRRAQVIFIWGFLETT